MTVKEWLEVLKEIPEDYIIFWSGAEYAEAEDYWTDETQRRIYLGG